PLCREAHPHPRRGPAPGVFHGAGRFARDPAPVRAGGGSGPPFFRRPGLDFLCGRGAPQDLWTRLETVSARTIGARVPLTSSWGTTETAPLATAAHFLLDRAGPIGVPAPGVEIKLGPGGASPATGVPGPNAPPGDWNAA